VAALRNDRQRNDRQPDQLELLGMPEPLYRATPSRLNLWRSCPRRYRFTYLDRPAPSKGAPWAHNTVGAAVHSALADWWRLPPERRTPDAGAGLVRRRWFTDGFRDAAQAGDFRERAAGWVTRYLEDADQSREPLGVERGVSATTGSLVLSGRADLIEDAGGEAVIVDYKTGRHVSTEQDAATSLPLAAYAVAAGRVLRRPCLQVELHHLPTETRAAHRHSAASLDQVIEAAEVTGAECAAADAAYVAGRRSDDVFPPVPGSGCSWCDFRRHCPEGRAAAPDRNAWSGLSGE
jgi:putative RecB family exonuclease